MRGIRMFIALLAVGVVAGCSSGTTSQSPVRSAVDPNLLAGCGPLDDGRVGGVLSASVTPQTSPTICTWRVSYPGGGTADLTYGWLENDTLMRDEQIAQAQGYSTEKTVIKRFGAMYWHDPRDPGSCGVTAADTGTVTWWVQNRDHGATPDPCAAAMALTQATLGVDGV